MGLEKFLKTVLVGALMMCPFVMLHYCPVKVDK